MKQNILRLFSTIAILLLFVAAADAKTRKGEKLLAEGKVAEDHGDWDKALDLYQQAVQIVLRDKKASTSYIQRRLQIGYNRAARLIERMEEDGMISKPNHQGKREILLPEGRE